MDQTASAPRDHLARAEECCLYATDSRSLAEKKLWLTIAENWLLCARMTNEEALQGAAQRIVACGRPELAGQRPAGELVAMPTGRPDGFAASSLGARAHALRTSPSASSRHGVELA